MLPGVDSQALLLFRVGPIACCCYTTSVESVTRKTDVTHIPGSDASEPGITKYSNSIVKLIDTRRRLGLETTEHDTDRTIIARLEKLNAGFIVDEIIDVLPIPASGWKNMPAGIPGDVFKKILLHKDTLYLLTDLDALAEHADCSYILAHTQVHNEKYSHHLPGTDLEPEHKTRTIPGKVTAAATAPVTDKPVQDVSPTPADVPPATPSLQAASNDSDATEAAAPKPEPVAAPVPVSPVSRQAPEPAPAPAPASTITADKQHATVQTPAAASSPAVQPARIEPAAERRAPAADRSDSQQPEPDVHWHEVCETDTGGNSALSAILMLTLVITIIAIPMYWLLSDDSKPASPTRLAAIPATTEPDTEPAKTAPVTPDDDKPVSKPEPIETPAPQPAPTQTGTRPAPDSAKPAPAVKITKKQNTVVIEVHPQEPSEPPASKKPAAPAEKPVTSSSPEKPAEPERKPASTAQAPDVAAKQSRPPAGTQPVATPAAAKQPAPAIAAKDTSATKATAKPTATSKPQGAALKKKSTRLVSSRVVHIVVKGDTLWHIAKRYVNNPLRYPELARLSKIKNPHLIYPGDKVIIIHYRRAPH